MPSTDKVSLPKDEAYAVLVNCNGHDVDLKSEPVYWLLQPRAFQDKRTIRKLVPNGVAQPHANIKRYIQEKQQTFKTQSSWEQAVAHELIQLYTDYAYLVTTRFMPRLVKLGILDKAEATVTQEILERALRWLRRLLDGAELSTVGNVLSGRHTP